MYRDLNYSLSGSIAVGIACNVDEQFLNRDIDRDPGRHRAIYRFKLLVYKRLYQREIHSVSFKD